MKPSGRSGLFRRFLGPKQIVLGALLALLAGLGWYLRQEGHLDPEFLIGFARNHPVVAPLAFIALSALAFFLMIPTLPLNLGAGVLWGPFWGGVIATAGGSLGAVAAFVAARTAVGQPFVRRFDNALVAWLQEELQARGWHIVAFARLSSVLPSGPISFGFGLTSIRFYTYTWASVVFFFPPAVAFATIGHELGGIVLEGEIENLVNRALIISGAITLVILAGVAAKVMINRKRPPS